METMQEILHKIVSKIASVLGFPEFPVTIVDIIEIIIIAILFYHILVWVKNTRAWNLFRGLVVILLFVIVAMIFQMNTILWIAKNMLNVGLIALVVIFQPELRKALDNLGGKSVIGRFFETGRQEEALFSDKTAEELVKACFAMGKVRTGALIVIENTIRLDEYIRTGIDLDACITSSLLINIFEKNTPLHDGAVITRGDRIVSATCYLPLSDSMRLSKDLGTRHRAAVGVSEVSDSMTIVVSEETGKVSVARSGRIFRDLTPGGLKEQLERMQNKTTTEVGGLKRLKRRIWNGKKNT